MAEPFELGFGNDVTPNSFRKSLKWSGTSAPSRMALQALRSAAFSSGESSGISLMRGEVLGCLLGRRRSIRVGKSEIRRGLLRSSKISGLTMKSAAKPIGTDGFFLSHDSRVSQSESLEMPCF